MEPASREGESWLINKTNQNYQKNDIITFYSNEDRKNAVVSSGQQLFYLARAGAEYGYMCRRFTISFFRALPRKMTRPRNVMMLMIRQMTHGRLWASSLPE